MVTDERGQVFVHADKEGLGRLMVILGKIKGNLEKGECDHYHLATDAWAGRDLSEKKGIQNGTLINEVTINGWTDEWAQKHGFR